MNTIQPLTIFREFQSSSGQRSDRSAGDRARHRTKVRDQIKEGIADIISEESLVGKSGDKIIKVPIRSIKEYRFVYGDNQPQASTGDGSAQPGQVVGKTGQQQQGQGKGKAGNEKGDFIYEMEITLDEIKEILFEELKLPNLRKTAKREIIDKSRAKKDGYRKMGINVRLDRFKTAKQRVKRKKATLRHGEPEQEACLDCNGTGYCDSAFLEEMGEDQVTNIICESCTGVGTVEKRFRFRREDRRFRHMETKPKPQSNAAIIFIMDVSASMGTEEKFLARSFFYILYEFIRSKYDRSEVVFISHTTEAEEVDEDRFFHTAESGGTIVSSGLKKALEIIQQRYNPSIWNNYVFSMSDGDNWGSDNSNCVKLTAELCKLANLVGYGEIKSSGYSYSSSLMSEYESNMKEDNFKSIVIKGREDVWISLQKFLSIDENTIAA